MGEPVILTAELTLKLEAAMAPVVPGTEGRAGVVRNVQVIRVGKAVARKVRGGWPSNAVFCFGEEDAGRIGEILAFFGETRPVFYLVHGGFGPGVGKALDEAGYYLHSWKQTILYGTPTDEVGAMPADVTIELVTEKTIEEAAQVAAEGNGWGAVWREAAKEGVRQAIGRDNRRLYLARYQGEPAGVGDLAGGGPGKWGGLGGGAVPERFRNKGIHTALLKHRMHDAHRLGCELVISGAEFGSTSFRNQQRVGMRLGYVEATWKMRE